jgi:hypothetical protein
MFANILWCSINIVIKNNSVSILVVKDFTSYLILYHIMNCCTHNNIDHGTSVQNSCYVIFLNINLTALVIYIISYQYNILNFYYIIANSLLTIYSIDSCIPLNCIAPCLEMPRTLPSQYSSQVMLMCHTLFLPQCFIIAGWLPHHPSWSIASC